MRSSALFAAAFAGSAIASPLVRRVYVTELDYTTAIAYVTDTVEATSTAVAQPQEENVVYTTETEAAAAQYVTETAYTYQEAPSSTSVAFTTYAPPPAPVETSSTSTEEASVVYVTEAAWTSKAATSVAAVTYEAATSSAAAATTYAAPAETSSSSSGFAFNSQCSTPTGTAMPSAATLTASPTGEAQRKWLAYHNVHRANHTDTCSMFWDYDLENTAQEWANQCSYWHNTTTGSTYSASVSTTWYGQNGGMYSESMSDTKAAVVFSNMYYQEGANYTSAYGSDQPTDGVNIPSGADIGHFTQMVWKGSYAVGCASQDCSSVFGADVPFVTWCNYRLTGNVDGEYADNIADLISTPLAPVCTDVETDDCIAEAEFV
ncbi:PR-1-like protein [Saccharata proteae CBS 121410]|uniref:PR-1-like protein n=1 Tax=Saccharata proteae CBS 121410 TaxID=1314787 RepID=A0A9P4LW32_9PEZI|nr:PR-1-like protein [Saccharata proteae CBS 121410]